MTSAYPQEFTATLQSAANWLSVTQSNRLTNASVQVALTSQASTLPAGSYSARLKIAGPNAPNQILADINLTVTAEETVPTMPAITAVAHAATYQPGALSPGMLVTIVGTRLGPTMAAPGEIVNGRFTTSTAGVWVYFDNIAAPLLYVSDKQINAIVPYQLAGRASAQLSVQFLNQTSAPMAVPLTDASPGIFTAGRQAAALNQDGSYNGLANPARPGDVVVLYLTGEGLVAPNGSDGEIIAAGNLRKPLAAVRVRVNGAELSDANILYAGSAPGLVAGLMQVNFRLPSDTPANLETRVEVQVGESRSPAGLIAVR